MCAVSISCETAIRLDPISLSISRRMFWLEDTQGVLLIPERSMGICQGAEESSLPGEGQDDT
jgi:hypothetical protein